MVDRLPPLTALRAFEAAARHMSFAKAADELSVTPAALSFQIKSLEEHLGTPVFRRLNRAVELTEAGRTLAPGARDAFETLTAAWRATLRLQDHSSLTVTAGPAFTAKCLAPRLFNFAQAHPEIELRFSASLRMMDFGRDDVDVAIRYGLPRDDGLVSHCLLEDYALPVMTPAMAERFPTPKSLTRAPLFHDDSIAFLTPKADWAAWFRIAGVEGSPPSGPRFSQADHAIDAALAGGGVLLGRSAFLAQAFDEGLLVAPFQHAIQLPSVFRLLCAPGTETRPHIAAFRAWITDEMAQDQAFLARKKVVPLSDTTLVD